MCTPGDVKRSLEVLPDTLTEVYGEIYKHIVAQKGSAPQVALKAFKWMQLSCQPVQTQTLLDKIAAEIGQSEEFFHVDTFKVNDLLRACHNLIILDEGLNVFRFAHLSVDEYLETHKLSNNFNCKNLNFCLSQVCAQSDWADYDKTVVREAHYPNRCLLLYSAVFLPCTLHVLKERQDRLTGPYWQI